VSFLQVFGTTTDASYMCLLVNEYSHYFTSLGGPRWRMLIMIKNMNGICSWGNTDIFHLEVL
jgi:hypothetical protein